MQSLEPCLRDQWSPCLVISEKLNRITCFSMYFLRDKPLAEGMPYKRTRVQRNYPPPSGGDFPVRERGGLWAPRAPHNAPRTVRKFPAAACNQSWKVHQLEQVTKRCKGPKPGRRLSPCRTTRIQWLLFIFWFPFLATIFKDPLLCVVIRSNAHNITCRTFQGLGLSGLAKTSRQRSIYIASIWITDLT